MNGLTHPTETQNLDMRNHHQSAPTPKHTIQTTAKSHTTSSTQRKIYSPEEDPNLGYGDTLIMPKPTQTLRVYCQNIRGVKNYESWDTWIQGHLNLANWDIDIAHLTETNIKWNHSNITTANKLLKNIHQQLRTNMTGSTEITESDYQPGGTYCSVHGKWTGRIIERITDSTGLGRWAGFRLEGRHQRNIIILSCYRPTKSQDHSDNTCFSQQWRLLRKSTPTKNPNPRTILINDLIKLTQQWQQENCDILIGMDANSHLDESPTEILSLIQETNLTSLHKHISAPATHSGGSKCIDFIFGTPRLANAVRSAGYLSFYEGAWPSDHRGLFVDINIPELIDGVVHNLDNPTKRHLYSNNRIQSAKFLTNLSRNKFLPALATQLFTLNNITLWEESDHKAFEEIDNQFTNILIQSEQRCAMNRTTPWSPELHEAYLIQLYWKITVSSERTRKSVHKKQTMIINTLTDPTKIWQGQHNRSSKAQLKRASKTLKEIKANAAKLREDFLTRQYTNYYQSKDNDKAKILLAIKKNEQKQRCFKTIKTYNKPTGEMGGLSHILISNGNNNRRIHNKIEMEHVLFERNRQHFAQADCTPCATGPLANLLGYSGISEFTDNILAGKPITEEILQSLPPTASTVLATLRRKRPQQKDWISIEEMTDGFHNWRESTTTSPSGKHLGIYRTLTKMYKSAPPQQQTTKRQDPTTEPTDNQHILIKYKAHYEVALLALRIQNLIINLAIRHTHTLQRWTIIHNFFLEKIPGRPILDKLRVIHLYEADWNLILKFFIAYKLNMVACREKTISTEQAGGRPGKNAADTATATVIMNEIILLQKLSGTLLYHDAKACFDRIIENISNASLLSEGINPKLVKLHANTLSKARYHIKTKYGVANTPNGHRCPDAFHGTGQGAADSMPRWGFLSDSAIKSYNQLAISEPIQRPFNQQHQLTTKIRAYVDDTNCPTITHKNDIEDLKATLIHNAKQWEALLFTIGGKLEISKCKFSCFFWKTEPTNGTVHLAHDINIGSISIQSSETRSDYNITEIAPTEPYKLLGVQMTLSGNTSGQEEAMRDKCAHMAKVFTMAPLNQNDVNTGYTSVILPTLKYGLGATNIPWYKLDKIQQQLTHTILPKMGFNRHLPRAIVYGPESCGGLGLQRLSVEQGLAHIQYMIGSIRANTDDSMALYILLESYIIVSGLIGNPFQNMTPTEYIDAPWIETIRILLNSIHATIKLTNLNTIPLTRVNDKGIMATAIKFYDDTTTLKMINNCRLYLQVHTLADITSSDGTMIRNEAFWGTQDKNSNPMLWHHTRSHLRWPMQPRPPSTAWKKWQSLLQLLTKKKTMLLRHPLREWVQSNASHRTWTHDTNTIISHTPRPATSSDMTPPTWTSRTFYKLEESERIDITIQAVSQYELSAFRWILAANSHSIMRGEAKMPPTLYAAKNQAILGCIIDALTTFTNEYTRRNAPKRIHKITIWTTCSKTVRLCTSYNWKFHTATTGIKEEDEFYRNITELTSTLPHCRFSKLDQHSPQWIIKMNGSDTLHTSDINAISRQFIPPPPRVIVMLKTEPLTCNIIQTLRHAYGSQDYREYIQAKYKWSDQTIETIDWQLLGNSLSNFRGSEKRTLQKFIHHWLPLNAHRGSGKTGSTCFCPCCNNTEETSLHFIQCPKDAPHWIKDIKHTLRCKTNQDPQKILTTLLCDALTAQANGRSAPLDPPDDLPVIYYQLYHEQTQIGWNHIVMGRWSKKWITEYDSLTHSTTGLRWATKIIKIIWKHIINKWKRRCDMEHETTISKSSSQNDHLDNQINALYGSESRIDHIDRLMLSTPIDTIKQLPTKKKKAWIRRITPHIRDAIQRTKIRTRQNNKSITQFFRPIRLNPDHTSPTRQQRQIRRNQSHADTYEPP